MININTSKLITNFPSYSNRNYTPKYIVIHDTAGMSSALGEAERLNNLYKDPNCESGIAHYYCDEANTYQLVEDKVKAYHSGDGPDGKGNGQSLSIEVCRSLPSGDFQGESDRSRYLKALDNAYQLSAYLCKKYGISPNNILQHKDLQATACPYTQKVVFGSYEKALSNAKKEVNNYFGGSESIPNTPEPTPPTNSGGYDKEYSENGTCTFNEVVSINNSPIPNTGVGVNYLIGESVVYDNVIYNDGYIWVSYIRNSTGKRAYCATGTYNSSLNRTESWCSFV
jgi:N-acetylmuramoyl-L-alanine amidase